MIFKESQSTNTKTRFQARRQRTKQKTTAKQSNASTKRATASTTTPGDEQGQAHTKWIHQPASPAPPPSTQWPGVRASRLVSRKSPFKHHSTSVVIMSSKIEKSVSAMQGIGARERYSKNHNRRMQGHAAEQSKN